MLNASNNGYYLNVVRDGWIKAFFTIDIDISGKTYPAKIYGVKYQVGIGEGFPNTATKETVLTLLNEEEREQLIKWTLLGNVVARYLFNLLGE